MKKLSIFVALICLLINFIGCTEVISYSSKSDSALEITAKPTSIIAVITPKPTTKPLTYTNNVSGKSFTNKFGTSTTKCFISGCNKYIATSGDSNCCVTHSNKCLDCEDYIDSDAAFCISCILKALDS